MIYLRRLILVAVLATSAWLSQAVAVEAGGGQWRPVNFTHEQPVNGLSYEFIVQINDFSSGEAVPVVGKDFKFEAHVDLPGAQCQTTQAKSDTNGYVKGSCSANVEGRFVFDLKPLDATPGPTFSVYLTESSAPAANPSITPSSKPSPTPQVPAISPQVEAATVQYLLVEEYHPLGRGGVELDLYLKAEVKPSDSRVILIPIGASAWPDRNELEYQLLEPENDPWQILHEEYGLQFTPSETYATLATQPQVFSHFTRNQAYSYLREQGIPLTQPLTAHIRNVLAAPQRQLLIMVMADKERSDSVWLPPVRINGIGWGVQRYLLPAVWRQPDFELHQNPTNLEFGAITIHAYRKQGGAEHQMAYFFQDQKLMIGDRQVSGNFVSEVKRSFDAGTNSGYFIEREYPENAIVSNLPRVPTPQAEDHASPPTIKPDGWWVKVSTQISHQWQDLTTWLVSLFEEEVQPAQEASLATEATAQMPQSYIPGTSSRYVQLDWEQAILTVADKQVSTKGQQMYVSESFPAYEETYQLHRVVWQEAEQEYEVYFGMQKDANKWWIADLRTRVTEEGMLTYNDANREKIGETALGEPLEIEYECLTSTDGQGELCFENLRLFPYQNQPVVKVSGQGYVVTLSPWDEVVVPLAYDVPTTVTAQLNYFPQKAGASQDALTLFDYQVNKSPAVLDQAKYEYRWSVADPSIVNVDGSASVEWQQTCCTHASQKPLPLVTARLLGKQVGQTTLTVEVVDTVSQQQVSTATVEVKVKPQTNYAP